MLKYSATRLSALFALALASPAGPLDRAAAGSGDRIDCRWAAGSEEVAEALCEAIAARLDPRAPAVVIEVISSQPRSVSARLGIVTDGRLIWGAPVTQDVIDRDSMPPGALERLAEALLRLAGETRPAGAPPLRRP